MKYYIGLLMLSLTFALSGANDAHAGVMDDHYTKVGSVEVLMSNATECQNIDVSLNWSEYILNAEKWDTAGNIQEAYVNQKLSLENAMEYGSWGVSIEYYPSYSEPTQKTVWVYWHETEPLIMTWYNGYGIEVGGEGVHVMPIHCENTPTPTARPNYPFNSIPVSRSHGNTRNYFITNAIHNIPEGYDGDFVRDADPNAGGSNGNPIDEKPRVKMDSLVKWEAKFSDQNFFSIDKPPFLCGDGFPPRVTMELWNKSANVLMLTETVSANSDLAYTFDNVTSDINYEIVSWYSCTDGTSFVEGASFYAFTVDRDGSLGIGSAILDTCMSTEFPFVQMSGCIQNVKVAMDAMSFGAVRMSNQWTNESQCRTLGTLGDWLNLEEKTVCPVFSEGVRNAITPFVTLALGLMMVKYVSKLGGNNG